MYDLSKLDRLGIRILGLMNSEGAYAFNDITAKELAKCLQMKLPPVEKELCKLLYDELVYIWTPGDKREPDYGETIWALRGVPESLYDADEEVDGPPYDLVKLNGLYEALLVAHRAKKAADEAAQALKIAEAEFVILHGKGG